MNKLNQFALILFAIFCIMLAPNNVDARVCFAAADDENCGSMNSFGDYTDPAVETADQCIKAGYDMTACAAKQHVGAVCPYNSKYIKCCGNSYAYSTCIYPLLSNGKCGNSWRCKCDDKFKYGVRQPCTNNSIPGGANCLQIDDDDKNMSIHYEKCVCDRGVFPYQSDSDCGLNQVVDTYNPCIDSSNSTFYRKCSCPSTWSSCVTMGPAIGAKKCVIDGETKYSDCCICARTDGYALNLSDANATEYENCPCNSSYRKIKRCKPGYKVSGLSCIEMTCKDAVQAWLDATPSRKNSYSIMENSGDSTKPNHIITENINPTYMRLGRSYYGAAYLGRYFGDSNIQAKCKTTPRIDWRFSSVDSSTTGSNFTYYYGLILNFTGSNSSFGGYFSAYNTSIRGGSAGSVSFNDSVYLYYESSRYNSSTDEPLYVKFPSTVRFYGYLYSTNHSFDVGTIGVHGSGVIYSPGTFKARLLDAYTDYANSETGITTVENFSVYSGDYYVVKAQLGWNRNTGRSYIKVMDGAKWYMYGDASSRHEVSVGYCSAMCVNSGGRIIHSNGTLWQGQESGRYSAYASCSTDGGRNPRSFWNNEADKNTDVRYVDWQYCNGSDKCMKDKKCW